MQGQRQKRRDEMTTQELLEGDTLRGIADWTAFPDPDASDTGEEEEEEQTTTQEGVPDSSVAMAYRTTRFAPPESQTLREGDLFVPQDSDNVIAISTDQSSESEFESRVATPTPASSQPPKPTPQSDPPPRFSPVPSTASSVSFHSDMLDDLTAEFQPEHVKKAFSVTAVGDPVKINLDLLRRVTSWLSNGHPVPQDLSGVWTTEDDQDLVADDEEKVNRVEQKHGAGRCEARWGYLES
jgi:hypothetical protein